MEKHYLFFCAHEYAIPILEPLQKEMEKRGDKVAWYLEKNCSIYLTPVQSVILKNLKEVKAWNPVAVFAPGTYVYDFFPGVKVEVFHGYPIYKRGGTEETHFKIRGWFDIYLTAGPSSTPIFKELERKYRYFRVYETGWSKADAMIYAKELIQYKQEPGQKKKIFVATTFSKRVTQLANLYPIIERLSRERDWEWLITRHPKLDDLELDYKFLKLNKERENVTYMISPQSPVSIADTDVMLCDSSSIILEYMMLDKPVVTLRNTTPGPHIINVEREEDVEAALEKAFTRPPELMEEMRKYLSFHEAHLDGHNCERILEAVDDYLKYWINFGYPRPLNLFRKLKIRLKYLINKPRR